MYRPIIDNSLDPNQNPEEPVTVPFIKIVELRRSREPAIQILKDIRELIDPSLNDLHQVHCAISLLQQHIPKQLQEAYLTQENCYPWQTMDELQAWYRSHVVTQDPVEKAISNWYSCRMRKRSVTEYSNEFVAYVTELEEYLSKDFLKIFMCWKGLDDDLKDELALSSPMPRNFDSYIYKVEANGRCLERMASWPKPKPQPRPEDDLDLSYEETFSSAFQMMQSNGP